MGPRLREIAPAAYTERCKFVRAKLIIFISYPCVEEAQITEREIELGSYLPHTLPLALMAPS